MKFDLSNRPARMAFLRAFLLLGMLFSGISLAWADPPLPSYFHDPGRIDTFLVDLKHYADSLHNAGYPQLMHIDTIGYSRGQALNHRYPLYAVRMSADADVFHDRPTTLIVGQVHAEEVIGVELTLKFMWLLVHQYGRYVDLLNAVQMYFIPTGNPDGLEIVSLGIDRTYRKNGYVPPELNGRPCYYDPHSGGDSCGVDLNRNFDLNWSNGHPLWYNNSGEPYDYYRGPSAASEPETQAICSLATRIKPTVSIVYHSSRTGESGGNLEKGIVAWKWGTREPYKYPPDSALIMALDVPYCQLLPKQESRVAFDAIFGGVYAGCTEDWFYWKLGCLQVVTELGPGENIQPADTTLYRVINDDLPSLLWMNNRPVNFNQDGPTPLAIYTKDSTGNAISAEFRVMNTWSPVLAPWYTNEEYGRATILARNGSCTILARKEGYRTATVTTTINPNYHMQTVTLRLAPLPWHTLALHLRDQTTGQPVSGRVFMDCDFPRWVDVSGGNASVSLPEGNYHAMAVASADGKMVLWKYINLAADLTQEIRLPDATSAWSENFEGGLTNWTRAGTSGAWITGSDTTSLHLGTSLFTNTGTYGYNWNATLTCNNTIALNNGNVAYLEFMRRGRLDVPADSVYLDISTDNGNQWQTAAGYCDLDIPWTRTFVNLTPWMGQAIRLRFRFITDNAMDDNGLQLDNMKLFGGLDSAAPLRPPVKAYSYRITQAYPNPFNPSCTISYEVAKPGTATLVVFNLLGEAVCRTEAHLSTAGPQKWMWNGTDSHGHNVVSGLYFVQLQAAGTLSTQKLLLIR